MRSLGALPARLPIQRLDSALRWFYAAALPVPALPFFALLAVAAADGQQS